MLPVMGALLVSLPLASIALGRTNNQSNISDGEATISVHSTVSMTTTVTEQPGSARSVILLATDAPLLEIIAARNAPGSLQI